MNVDKIISDLDITQKIVGKWSVSSQISVLERDLVLEKLRGIYEIVLLKQLSNLPENSNHEFEAIELTGEIEPRAIEDMQIEVQKEIYELKAEIEIEKQTQIEKQTEPESDPEPEPIQQVVAQINEVPPVLDVVDQSLFSEGSIQTKPKIDRRIILSLYGDDPIQESAAPEMYIVDRQPDITTGTEPQSANTTEQTITEPTVIGLTTSEPVVAESIVATPQITTFDKPHTETLGDVMGKGNQTVGDMIFTVTDKVDVATKVVTESSTSLRKMIGINDKFLMIRDLFNGNAADYEQSINALEVFTDLDDALIYIHETYSWNPNSEGVKLMIELLTRKLS